MGNRLAITNELLISTKLVIKLALNGDSPHPCNSLYRWDSPHLMQKELQNG